MRLLPLTTLLKQARKKKANKSRLKILPRFYFCGDGASLCPYFPFSYADVLIGMCSTISNP